jgi:hypothetical protein
MTSHMHIRDAMRANSNSYYCLDSLCCVVDLVCFN